MPSVTAHNPPYIGRFAPSPSGPLHLGSLVCALASYLDAKQHQGQWLVRIEDIDPDREPPGATQAILRTLDAHGLHWDGEVWLQSQRSERYLEILEHLKAKKQVYPCNCTRKRLSALKGPYDGHCLTSRPRAGEDCALRLHIADSGDPGSACIEFHDRVYGHQREDLREISGDFIVHRKQGLFAYQLVVVIDDIDQGITDIVRGSDILETTARQIYLYHLLGQTPPRYGHLPVVLDHNGLKLSKQNHAPALDDAKAADNLRRALCFLGVDVAKVPARAQVPELLDYGLAQFRMESLKAKPA